jgi:recombination endonuclease VII
VKRIYDGKTREERQRQASAAYYARNLEKRTQQVLASRRRHPETTRHWRARNRDRINARKREWRAAASEEVRAARREYQRAYVATHQEWVEVNRQRQRERYRATYKPGQNRHYVRYRRYRLTASQFAALLESQAQACAICRRPFGGSERPNVDHNHQSGKIRGILCVRCNSLIGMVSDNQVTLLAAADYLERSVQRVSGVTPP